MVGGGAPSATDDLNRTIYDQTLRIDQLTDLVVHWRELYENRNSNTLHGLLRKLQIVLRLQFDDPDSVYVAVAEAIYAHSTSAQRREISDAPVNKDGFIDYLVDVLKADSSDTVAYDSDAFDSDTEVTDTPNKDGIEQADRPTSAQRTPSPDSARAQKQNEKAGFMRRATTGIKSAVNRARGISGAKSDLSTLLRDLKHMSENDAYAPPI